jgi:hypothetical protein
MRPGEWVFTRNGPVFSYLQWRHFVYSHHTQAVMAQYWQLGAIMSYGDLWHVAVIGCLMRLPDMWSVLCHS